MNTFTEAEKLREEFYAEHLTENKTSIKSSPAEIADWWLSKLQNTFTEENLREDFIKNFLSSLKESDNGSAQEK